MGRGNSGTLGLAVTQPEPLWRIEGRWQNLSLFQALR